MPTRINDDTIYHRAQRRAKTQDERWLAALPDYEFSLTDAAFLLQVCRENARVKVQMLELAGLVQKTCNKHNKLRWRKA